MHENVIYNWQIYSGANAKINSVSSAALYGKGIFTTIAVYNAKPFLWEKHWQTLQANALKLNIDLSNYSEETLKNSLSEIIKKNAVENGRARITLFDESSSVIWPFETKRKTGLLITTADFLKTPKNFRLTVSPYLINSTSPLSGIKSCNYLEKILAHDEARKRGFDEAVCINERGEIVSALMANLFWLKDRKLFTPSLKTGCLAGTAREYVMENVECFEAENDLESVRNADTVFLTSAGIGVVQVAEFDGRMLEITSHAILYLVPPANSGQ